MGWLRLIVTTYLILAQQARRRARMRTLAQGSRPRLDGGVAQAGWEMIKYLRGIGAFVARAQTQQHAER